ncbi:FAD:protein FMN transferase (plasmid) [Rhodobacteraceae bacterium SC52]|nr:FAD:protein FMN transferase [Rhodobacteraceae bacterium SC52]
MTQTRRRFLAIAASFAAVPVAARASTPAWTGIALGAEASITLDGPASRTKPALDDAIAALRQTEQMFSLFDPASDLVRLNQTGVLSRPPDEMLNILALADQVHRASGGRFDPTVQPLWQALAQGRDPSHAATLIGWDRVERTRAAIRLGDEQALTLNGIAQGFATDRVQAVLRRHGFGHTLVNIGEFAADGGPWRLGIADPEQGIVLTRSLTNGAMATSSPGALRLGGHGHILDPKGHAAHWSTVTVQAQSAALADAASTALCLASRSDIPQIKARLPGLRQITAIDAEGNVATF